MLKTFVKIFLDWDLNCYSNENINIYQWLIITNFHAITVIKFNTKTIFSIREIPRMATIWVYWRLPGFLQVVSAFSLDSYLRAHNSDMAWQGFEVYQRGRGVLKASALITNDSMQGYSLFLPNLRRRLLSHLFSMTDISWCINAVLKWKLALGFNFLGRI